MNKKYFKWIALALIPICGFAYKTFLTDNSDYLDLMVERGNKQLPMALSDQTVLYKIGKGKDSILYFHETTDEVFFELSEEELKSLTIEHLKENFKMKTSIPFKSRGIELKYIYKYPNTDKRRIIAIQPDEY